MENTEKKRQKVYLLCGPAGSGKSTLAHKLMQPQTDLMISRDALRFMMLKEDDDYFAIENEVRKKFFETIKKWTSRDDYENIFVDATHLTPKARNQARWHMQNNPYKIAISVEVPIQIALERNSQRSGRAFVPETVIRNMHTSYKIPTLSEGFDEVWHVDAEGVITKEVKNG